MSEASWIPRLITTTKTAQDASGATIVTSGDPQVDPNLQLGDDHIGVHYLDRLDSVRAIEEGMDADVPVDAQNAPTSDFENCTEYSFQQRPHPSVGS